MISKSACRFGLAAFVLAAAFAATPALAAGNSTLTQRVLHPNLCADGTTTASANICQHAPASYTAAFAPSQSKGIELDPVNDVLLNTAGYYNPVYGNSNPVFASNSSSNSYFVPQNTPAEFQSFLEHLPQGVTLTPPIMPTTYTGTALTSGSGCSSLAWSGGGTVAVPAVSSSTSPPYIVSSYTVPLNPSNPTTTTTTVGSTAAGSSPIQFTASLPVTNNLGNVVATRYFIQDQQVTFSGTGTFPNYSWAASPNAVLYYSDTSASGPWSSIGACGPPPVAGVCGTAATQTLTVQPNNTPAGNLCSVGTVHGGYPNGISGNGPWTWTCDGVNGGASSGTCTTSGGAVCSASTTLSWTVGGYSCSGQTTALTNSASTATVTETTPNTGHATFLCRDGSFGTAQTGATCAPAQNCNATLVDTTSSVYCNTLSGYSGYGGLAYAQNYTTNTDNQACTPFSSGTYDVSGCTKPTCNGGETDTTAYEACGNAPGYSGYVGTVYSTDYTTYGGGTNCTQASGPLDYSHCSLPGCGAATGTCSGLYPNSSGPLTIGSGYAWDCMTTSSLPAKNDTYLYKTCTSGSPNNLCDKVIYEMYEYYLWRQPESNSDFTFYAPYSVNNVKTFISNPNGEAGRYGSVNSSYSPPSGWPTDLGSWASESTACGPVCGSSNNTSFSGGNTPTSGLCSDGSTPAVSGSSGASNVNAPYKWGWTCGGNSCSASCNVAISSTVACLYNSNCGIGSGSTSAAYLGGACYWSEQANPVTAALNFLAANGYTTQANCGAVACGVCSSGQTWSTANGGTCVSPCHGSATLSSGTWSTPACTTASTVFTFSLIGGGGGGGAGYSGANSNNSGGGGGGGAYLSFTKSGLSSGVSFSVTVGSGGGANNGGGASTVSGGGVSATAGGGGVGYSVLGHPSPGTGGTASLSGGSLVSSSNGASGSGNGQGTTGASGGSSGSGASGGAGGAPVADCYGTCGSPGNGSLYGGGGGGGGDPADGHSNGQCHVSGCLEYGGAGANGNVTVSW